eukprot:s1983_g6.t1
MAKNAAATSRYANPDSVHNVAAVRQMFPFQGSFIEEIELRGICLEQLKRIRLYAHTCSFHWWDNFPKEVSPSAGEMLTTEILNFHHLGVWLVKPATKEHRCSFSELFPRQKASPFWFVSHAWAQRYVDFLACVQSHIAARSLNEASPYWVCAFAQRLHNAPSEGATAVISEGLRVALTASQGILLCADGALDRLWCCYERLLARGCGCSHTDVAVRSAPQAAVLLDNATDKDLFLTGQIDAGPAPRHLVPTLSEPNLAELRRGLSLQVELTSATQDADRRYILNVLADTDVKLPPPDAPESYVAANAQLRASWAALLWRPLLEEQHHVPELAKQIVESRCPSLALNFGSCHTFDDAALAEVAKAFHDELKEVRLNLAGCSRLSNRGLESFLELLPRKLDRLELDLRRTAASEESLAALLAAVPAQLCLGLSAGVFAAPPAPAPQLTSLRLDLKGDFDLRLIASWLPGTLQSLALQVSETALSAEDVGNVLVSLPRELEHLALCASGPAAGDAAMIAAAMAARKSLEVRFGPESALSDAGVTVAAPLLQARERQPLLKG